MRPGDCVAIEVDEQAAGKGPDVPVGDAVGRGELRSTRRARSRSLRRPAWRNRVRPGGRWRPARRGVMVPRPVALGWCWLWLRRALAVAHRPPGLVSVAWMGVSLAVSRVELEFA